MICKKCGTGITTEGPLRIPRHHPLHVLGSCLYFCDPCWEQLMSGEVKMIIRDVPDNLELTASLER